MGRHHPFPFPLHRILPAFPLSSHFFLPGAKRLPWGGGSPEITTLSAYAVIFEVNIQVLAKYNNCPINMICGFNNTIYANARLFLLTLIIVYWKIPGIFKSSFEWFSLKFQHNFLNFPTGEAKPTGRFECLYASNVAPPLILGYYSLLADDWTIHERTMTNVANEIAGCVKRQQNHCFTMTIWPSLARGCH